MKIRYVLTVLMTLCIAFPLSAEDRGEKKPGPAKSYSINHFFEIDMAYYFAHHWGRNTTRFSSVNYNSVSPRYLERRDARVGADPSGGRDDMGLAFSAQLKAFYTFQMTFPVMKTDNFLMKENNVKFKYQANLSPISFETGPYVEITPIAFLVFEFGSKVGTGWDFAALDVNGLAINEPDFRSHGESTLFKPTPGVVSISKMQATLQFDTGALIEGDWTHVVLAVVENIEYWYFSGARNNQYWRWEHDEGENQNGFRWYQTFVLGYQMPKRPGNLDLVGIIVETDQRITGKYKSTVKSGGGVGFRF